MQNPHEFIANNSHEEISRCIVHQLTQNESTIGAILKTSYGYFWLDFRNEVYSNTFFRTLKETLSEFNMWLNAETSQGCKVPN
ncbi:hypothetical protein [Pseudobacteriovorax antillogorgiicola]|uniref:Uncharacterized protein n=1 Tax=Pseudobacteriovorax antillogorgiicola TaxID=1513793 RepID=A0A1Y6BY82_9BACT|nr:hypothetical protein [Pseudobacteriovorax antillogorgiicola]TCS53074.1 hypothetical protein EDD56_108125 [Pseudobacteriovorax antillogorgiicola]SMF26175.1 hypothetical protein SAMN06296036_108122 [Pseudobacteriovorax antillogorgiicola]